MFGPLRTGCAKLGLASLAAALCGGCAVSVYQYEVERYGLVAATHVHLGCHDTYEVFDRPDAQTFLVGTTPANEAIAGLCSDRISAMSQPERLRRVAQIFLEETTDRPTCTILQDRVITPYQTEFSYRCPVPAAAKPAPVSRRSAPRRQG